MRKALIVVLLTAWMTGPAAADPARLPPWKHLLPLSPGAIALINESVDRSSIVEDMIRKLEETGLVVYLTDAMPGVSTGPASYLTYLTNTEEARYLLIRIDRWRTSPVERIALLGHELQHALEVAEAPEVRDAPGLIKLYRRIGWEGQKDKFETEAARVAGNRVRSQVAKGEERKRAAVIATNP